ncbi:hypothetical protein SHI21_19740 [Bacteriovorax sp. PP10]|uniref:Pentapeptide MXKDX repeat protein n=1 Tax=Bacteriovorax antarcticus TaxID=3088717 RepID=A0ABU5VZH5_9BACT|nr:hypothetical protein [Bacteriovorax sp. PP10]MEA9358479.1 hypothetical protein [Bacteriovorax sp. PP10]
MKIGNLNHLHLKLAFALAILFSSITFSADKEMNKMNKMNGMETKNMDMNKMHTMMKECMAKQEDDKMCHKEIMEKCEKGMSMNKCKDLMNNMKK